MANTSGARRMLVGNALIFTATLFWGLNVPADKFLIPHWISGADLGVTRIVGSTILIWLTSLFLKMGPVQRKDWWRLICAGVALFAFILLLSISFKYASPIDISIIMIFPPLFVLIIKWLFMHTRAGKLEILGMAIAFAGAVFLILMGASGDKEGNRFIGDIIVFVSCIGYAIYLVLVEGPSKTYRPFNLTRWVNLFASICCIPFLWGMPKDLVYRAPEALPLIILILVVLLPSYVAYLIVPPAVKRIGSDLVAAYQYVLPVIATIGSIAVGLARFEWFQPVAFGIILVGVWLANRGKFKNKDASAVAPGVDAQQHKQQQGEAQQG